MKIRRRSDKLIASIPIPANSLNLLEDILIHSEFIEQIIKESPEKILEVGCGRGTISIFLSQLGHDVTAVDKDEGVVEAAKAASKNLNANVTFNIANASKLPFKNHYFDICFSQGILEHFSDEDIIRLLKEQLRVSKKVIFSVPSLFYNSREIGDERLLTKSRWEKILKNFEVELSLYYYRIQTKRNFNLKLPLMYMAKIK